MMEALQIEVQPARRKRSAILDGYPGEELFLEQTKGDEKPMTINASHPIENKSVPTTSSGNTKRPSFLAGYLRSSPKGEIASEKDGTRNSLTKHAAEEQLEPYKVLGSIKHLRFSFLKLD